METIMLGRRTVRIVLMLLAATAVAGSAVLIDPMHTRYYETGSDQSRTIECSGNSVTVGEESRIAIRCTRALLHVYILRGAASFAIGDDPSKSVLVFSGNATISDSGGLFAVHRESDRSSIRVTRGLVQLSVEQPGPFGTAGLVWEGERATVFDAGTHINSGATIVLIGPDDGSVGTPLRPDTPG